MRYAASKSLRGELFRTLMAFLVTAFSTISLNACGIGKPLPDDALSRSELPQLDDDLPLEPLRAAIPAHVGALERSAERTRRFGSEEVPVKEIVEGYRVLDEILGSSPTPEAAARSIAERFVAYKARGRGRGELLLTGYFEPEIEGAAYPTDRFTQPLYGVPPDLLTIDLSLFGKAAASPSALKGRITGSRVVPYYTRNEIDVGNVLRGRGLELCWVDPIDAFFLQIQGSGTVRYPSGGELVLAYGDKNGRPYFAVGKALSERLPPQELNMTGIQRALRGMPPGERQRILDMNESYVFFRRSKSHAVTSIGVEAIPGRTIATDPSYFPKGGLGILVFDSPVVDAAGRVTATRRVSRLVIDQDTGGAITGPARADLFWGRGQSAGRHAGSVKDDDAELYYLRLRPR